ncbi:helix-turn-helix domain-containing protein [Caulobacter sp. RHG1]|uniref:helix-turn-helix domain-containing protein n=1 Tax=Caulobacter sp. (strain RHG1) TaxID=2545762 RepID=UPI001555FC9B|nr:helix-turn-helix transcriptional regulator [Caulobacter sp. RHG1]NQE64471.1 Transcriptional regulator, Xre family [Caulobacter sp. RHG1]
MADSFETRTPNYVDLHVGGRVRIRRKMIDLSQEQLADAIGLTFQQVQKYERGANRISASKLYEIARTLQVPVSFFFDGLADPVTTEPTEVIEKARASERIVSEFLSTPEGMELAELFPKIDRGPLRRQIVDLVRAMGVSET